ncbi:hypothetical protein V6N12_038027 [Hibiscus sabdariffa]|uniref:NB-ARC domain-containing protein n=1 Tax=Hibiscus sabdariffa TaxID=183260 RepID=A0ABR2BWG3_9ROSI
MGGLGKTTLARSVCNKDKNENVVLREIQKELKEKNFLLVLDDIWFTTANGAVKHKVETMTINKIYDLAKNLLPDSFNFHSEVVKKLKETGFENMSLGDVLRITSLTIDGKPVIGDDTLTDSSALCSNYLGNDRIISNKTEISLPLLRDEFGKFNPNHVFEETELKIHVQY